MVILSISIDNFAPASPAPPSIAYMSGLTSPGFAATQYALLSSLYALPGKLIGGASGAVVDAYGYPAPLHRHGQHRHPAGDPVLHRQAGYDADGRRKRTRSSTRLRCRRCWFESLTSRVIPD